MNPLVATTAPAGGIVESALPIASDLLPKSGRGHASPNDPECIGHWVEASSRSDHAALRIHGRSNDGQRVPTPNPGSVRGELLLEAAGEELAEVLRRR